MSRTLIFMGLLAMNMSKAPSCKPPVRVEPLYLTIQEELKKEFPHIKFVVYDTSDATRPNGHKIVITDEEKEI